jgi:hypothetical protein
MLLIVANIYAHFQSYPLKDNVKCQDFATDFATQLVNDMNSIDLIRLICFTNILGWLELCFKFDYCLAWPFQVTTPSPFQLFSCYQRTVRKVYNLRER